MHFVAIRCTSGGFSQRAKAVPGRNGPVFRAMLVFAVASPDAGKRCADAVCARSSAPAVLRCRMAQGMLRTFLLYLAFNALLIVLFLW